MAKHVSVSRRIFIFFNYIFLGVTAFICILPMINVLAVSLSSSSAAAAGYVKLWPVDFTLDSYKYALSKPEFVRAFIVSLKRVALGYVINILLCILVAYPLSKSKKMFKWRNFYAWFFIITMLFNGGLIPTYMVVRYLGLRDNILALILPGAVPVYFMILLMNFFRELPQEIEEAAYIDGADYWTSLWKIYIPLSKPALATVTLFIVVGHWNSWFDGLIYMNSMENYPLQSYLQTTVIGVDFNRASLSNLASLAEVSDRTFKAAQVFVGSLPILIVYPFLQPFFIKGLVLGSVKG
ncbi:MAG TPA: carbohydrate ABC transporter permease [Clostridiaceae bacterium]|nr:carbohydrate ABC transporter permease [Clostridiaceae bacterium]